MNNRNELRVMDYSTVVYGPAYLDCVVRIQEPLIANNSSVIDIGSSGFWTPGSSGTIKIIDTITSGEIIIEGPEDLHLISGVYEVQRVLPHCLKRNVTCTSIQEDLGGMGAGYAAAMGGMLVSCLSQKSDVVTEKILNRLDECKIAKQIVYCDHHNSDWTLLISSGEFGDKLPIGLRGCHDQVSFDELRDSRLNFQPSVVVIASLKNEIMIKLLQVYSRSIRLLAPAARNCRGQATHFGMLAGNCEILTLNETEWSFMDASHQSSWLDSESIIIITKAAAGAEVSWKSRVGTRLSHFEPVFPRRLPPTDTNRAGEAFGSAFLQSMLSLGWNGDYLSITIEMIRESSRIAAVTAGLTINLAGFGFPDTELVARTLRDGMIIQ